MKKTTLFTLLIGLIFNIQAQVDYYTLAQDDNSGYPDTSSSATTLWTTGADEEEQTGVPIGFDFYYGGKMYNTCTVGVNGAISFTETNISFSNNLSSTGVGKRNMIAPFWDDLRIYESDGYVAYETIGTAPNRIFKVSWKNISKYLDSSHDMSFILELKETSNEIIFYYGHCDNTSSINASIGFNYYDGTNTTFISVTPDSGMNPTQSRTTANNSIGAADYPRLDHYTFTFNNAYNDYNTNPRSIILADPRDNSSIVMNYMNNIGATNSPGTPSCANYNGGDVWYKFTAPSTGAVSFVRNTAGGIGVIGYEIYENSVTGPSVICSLLSGASSYLGEPKMVGGLTSGHNYYVRMWDYNNNDFGISEFYVVKVEPNDEAEYAIDVNVQPEGASIFSLTTANNTFAMDSEHINGTPTCGSYQGGDVWYKFTAPSTGEIKVHHSSTAGDWSSFVFAVYNSATSSSALDCQIIFIAASTPPYSVKLVTGLTAGQDYWLRVWDYGNNNVGYSQFFLTDNDNSGIEDYQQLSFKFYPNPATDVLNVSADSNINLISITNLLGQEVRHLAPNQKQVVLNIADLQNGVYMMRVKTGEKISTVKFIKK